MHGGEQEVIDKVHEDGQPWTLDKLPSDLLAKCVSLASGMSVLEIYRLGAVSQSFREVARSHSLPEVREIDMNFPRMRSRDGIFRDEARSVLKGCSGVETLSFSGNEWLVDDGMLEFIAENCPKIRRLDLSRCRLLNGTGLRALRHTHLEHLSLDHCVPNAAEQIFERAWRGNRMLGTDSQEDTEYTGEDAPATPDLLLERRREKQNGLLFPHLKFLSLNYLNNVDDKYLAMLSKHAHKLQHLSLRGCDNVTVRGVYRVIRSIKSLQSIDLSFCPQLDVQLLLNTFQCDAMRVSSLIFPLDNWTPSGMCTFRSLHPEFHGFTFVI